MASVALGIAGGYIGGAIGGPAGAKIGWSIGTLIGTAIENAKIPRQEVGKLDSLDVTGSSYGASIAWVYGRHRLAGNFIWSTPLQETSKKSGARLLGTRKRTFSYSVSCAVMICRGPITAVRKIWADDLLIYDNVADSGLANEIQQISVGTNGFGSFSVKFQGSESGSINFAASAATVQSTLQAMSSIGPGGCSVTGPDGGPWIVTFTGALAGRDVSRMDMDEGSLTGGSGEGITTIQQGGSKYDVTVYLGDYTQMPNATMQAALGAVPAYRGRAYVVFENLPLGDFGNRMPNFQFEVEALPAYEDVVMADQPAVYYRFEDTPGTLADSSGNGYDQTLTAGTTAQLAGAHGEGLSSIAGTSTRQAVVGNVAALQPAALSAESWFKYKGGSPTSGANRWRYRNPTSGEFAWELVLEPNLFTSDLVVSFRIFTNAEGTVTVHQYSFARDTEWHHAVVAYDTAGDSVLYLDGAEVDRTAAPVDPVTITASAGNLIELVIDDNIHVDEVAFYPAALSATQVAAHWQQRVFVRDVLADVFGEVGLLASQWAVSEATDEVDGLKIDSRTEARQAIAPLLQVYATDLLERDGKLAAKKRGGASVVTIPADDLAARLWSPGDEPPSPVQAKRLQELELPFRCDLVYHSATKDYEIATQGSMRYTKQHLQEALTLQTALVFADDAARQKAEELLYRLWIEREGFEFSLPPRYAYLTPGDVIMLPVAGGSARVRLTRLDLGMPGPIRCEGVLDDVDVLSQVAEAGALTDIGNIPGAVKDTTLLAWSSNAVVDEDADTIGFYAAANGAETGYWPGAQLWWSRDGGSSYQELAPLDSPAIYGTAATVLAAGTTTGLIDTVSTVDVTMTNGVPETVSDSEMLAGENRARLGDEIIGFGEVAPLGGGVYRLSRLLRGRRGTDPFWDTHAVGEPFVLLEEGLYTRLELPDDLVGAEILLKATTADGQPLAEATAVPLTITGAEWLPYTVVDIQGTRNGSNDLTLTWVRRTRKGGEWQDYEDAPLSETTEEYRVEILDGVTVVRMITVTSPTATYLASEQSADGLTPGDPVTVRIAQLGRIGYGYEAEATV